MLTGELWMGTDLRGEQNRWQHRDPPASPAALRRLSAAAPAELPEEYFALLRFSNGGEGALTVEPGWFQLWPAEQVPELNRGYKLAEFLPGFFGFGSNGGGELLAIDLRDRPPYRVVMVPFISMCENQAVTIAESFAKFVSALGKMPRS